MLRRRGWQKFEYEEFPDAQTAQNTTVAIGRTSINLRNTTNAKDAN